MRDRETGGRFLLTKEQAELLRADNEEARRSEGGLPELSARCQRWLDELEVRHGVLRRDFERERERATEDATEDDILWRLLELLARQKRDYTELTELYEARARFLDEIGRDFGEELRRARAVELLAIKEQGDTEYVKLRGADCKTCMEMDGRRIALERAMREMPLPASDCERTSGQSGKPLCTCTYAPVQNPELRADPSDNSEQENGL